nr:ubiquitin-conjugating enzyme e2 j1 [Quercus suber]
MSTKGPTLKRILKEASELASQPSSDYHAAPLESDLYEWHFTLRGPPAPSPFAGGLYHGRIILPPAYPLKPPSFRFVTPTGRFEVGREICLSISGHHEESWQPAWGIRTALVAIRSFMDTAAGGQVGGMEASESARVRMAAQSIGWTCVACGKSNEEIITDHDRLVAEIGKVDKTEDVPGELRLTYREDLGKAEENGKTATDPETVNVGATVPSQPLGITSDTATQQVSAQSRSQVDTRPQQAPQTRGTPAADDGVPAWIDKAILGVVAALVIMILRLWINTEA